MRKTLWMGIGSWPFVVAYEKSPFDPSGMISFLEKIRKNWSKERLTWGFKVGSEVFFVRGIVILMRCFFICSLLESRIPTVLDTIAWSKPERWEKESWTQNRPANQQLWYVCPLVSNAFVSFENNVVFLWCPRVLPDVGIQVIVPPLTALLADSSIEMGGDRRPIFGTMCSDKRGQLLVFLRKTSEYQDNLKGKVNIFSPLLSKSLLLNEDLRLSATGEDIGYVCDWKDAERFFSNFFLHF
jgi:hypothetical protein